MFQALYWKRTFANNWPHPLPPHKCYTICHLFYFILFYFYLILFIYIFWQTDCDSICFFNPPPTPLLQIFERHAVCLEDLFEMSNYFDAPVHIQAVYFFLGVNHSICETSTTHSRKARDECIWILLLPISEFFLARLHISYYLLVSGLSPSPAVPWKHRIPGKAFLPASSWKLNWTGSCTVRTDRKGCFLSLENFNWMQFSRYLPTPFAGGQKQVFF